MTMPMRRRSARQAPDGEDDYVRGQSKAESLVANASSRHNKRPRGMSNPGAITREQLSLETPPSPPLTMEKNGRASKRAKREPDNGRSDYFEDESDSPDVEDADDGDFEDGGEDEVKEEEDDDDDESGQDESAPMRSRVIPIKEEVLRPDGGVEYAEDKVHVNSVLFLKDLRKHNQRDWLKSHDGEYRRASKDWESFVNTVTQTVIEVDETVPELPFKDVNFRIHRDVRFSKDPTPYKPHFSAAFSRTGRKGPYACYYVHCKPGESFVGGGLWCPGPDALRALRRSIDRHPDRWYDVFNQRAFNDTFLRTKSVPEKARSRGGSDCDPKTAFYHLNSQHALQRWPKGYDRNHPNLELIKLKSFTVSRKVDDEFWTGEDVQEKLGELFSAMEPFVTFLNGIVMPDPDAEASEESDEGE